MQMRSIEWRQMRGLLCLLGFSSIVAACNFPQQSIAPTAAAQQAGIAGRVWHDICAAPGPGQTLPENAPAGCVLSADGSAYIANGRLDQDETGIGSVEVRLGQGSCPSFGMATTRTEPDGLFLFSGLAEGSYCVSIDAASASNSGLLLPGTWTYPAGDATDNAVFTQVELEPEEIQADVYFAWDYELLPPYQPESTTVSPTETSTPGQAAPTPTDTPEVTSTVTVTPTAGTTASPTLGAEDPRSSLSAPTWVDDFEDQSDWALYSDDHARFEIAPEGLKMIAFNPDFFNSWVLSWRNAKDLYLETTGTFGSCAGRDSYGLMIRSKGGDKGYTGYLFGVSCDGRYSLRSWDGETMTTIVGWTSDENLHSGPEATNRVGIMADGDRLRLYANGEFLMQIKDASHGDEGLFGLFVSSAQTANFNAVIEEISFWNLD
jgi:hypothetical protein